MKRQMNIMLVAILVMLGALIVISIRGQKTTIVAAAALDGATPRTALPAQVQPVPALVPMPAAVTPIEAPQPPAVVAPVYPLPAAAPAPQPDANKPANWGAGEKLGYTAVKGDTLSDVAAGLRGSDSKKNRDAVIAANPSLQADPDRVLTGKTYVLSAADATPAAVASSPAPAVSVPATQPSTSDVVPAKADPVLRYTAQPGDNVSILAAGLLGADSKTNRDAIVSQNPSLQNDPDHVIAGKTYKIPAGNGLSAAPGSAVPQPALATSQPDADGVVKIGTGRELRYTARAGDTVSKLAEALLGSDTQANRDAIINNNASLKSDPDHVVTGQSYWIPAPTAPGEQP